MTCFKDTLWLFVVVFLNVLTLDATFVQYLLTFKYKMRFCRYKRVYVHFCVCVVQCMPVLICICVENSNCIALKKPYTL